MIHQRYCGLAESYYDMHPITFITAADLAPASAARTRILCGICSLWSDILLRCAKSVSGRVGGVWGIGEGVFFVFWMCNNVQSFVKIVRAVFSNFWRTYPDRIRPEWVVVPPLTWRTVYNSASWKGFDLRFFASVQNRSPLYSDAIWAKSLFYFSRKVQKTPKNDTF